MSAKGGKQWQTVTNRTEEKKKRAEERKAADVQRDRLGVAVESGPFAAFDAQHASAKHGNYSGAFAGLEDEEPTVAPSDDSGAEDDAGAANGAASPAAAAAAGASPAPKRVKPKKPRTSVGQAAAGVDVTALETLITEVGVKYANSEASQVQVVADWLLKAFKEAQLEFNKGLAEKGVAKMAAVPWGDVPPPLASALASFVSQCSADALAQVLPDVLAAVFDGLPEVAPRPGTKAAAATPPPPKPKVGLLLLLAATLRTRPEVLVLAAPAMLAAGRQLSAPARLPQLLWVLSQAGEVQPGAALAAWGRVLLPQLVGVSELPTLKAKTGGEGGAAGAAPAPAPAGITDPASQLAALRCADALLAAVGAGGPDVGLSDGSSLPIVTGGVVECLSRGLAAQEQQQQQQQQPSAGKPRGGGRSSSVGEVSGDDAAEVLRRLAALHAPLMVLAGSSASDAQHPEWLQLALHSAALAAGPPGRASASDPLVARSAAAVTSCLAASDACFALWESKHKGQLRGSCRVLWALAARPDALRVLQRSKGKATALRNLAAALPARHASLLHTGKGWQAACARAAQGACVALQGAVGGRSAGAAQRSGGGVGDAVLSVAGVLAVGAGVVAAAAWHRREVAALAAQYLGDAPAHALDASLLAPLRAQLEVAATASEPLVRSAVDAAAPRVTAAMEAAAPAVAAAREALAPLLASAQEATAPLLAAAQEATAPLLAAAQEATAPMLASLQASLAPLAALAAEQWAALVDRVQEHAHAS